MLFVLWLLYVIILVHHTAIKSIPVLDKWIVLYAVLPLASEYTDDEGVRFTLEVQPPSSRAVSIAGSYHCSWKPRSNHFQNYADFKPKGFHLQFLLLIFD